MGNLDFLEEPDRPSRASYRSQRGSGDRSTFGRFFAGTTGIACGCLMVVLMLIGGCLVAAGTCTAVAGRYQHTGSRK